MEDLTIRKERAQNLWSSFARKMDPVAQATTLEPLPDFSFDRIGGLAGPKEEILTYACPADFDGDDAVGPFDLALLLGAWGECV